MSSHVWHVGCLMFFIHKTFISMSTELIILLSCFTFHQSSNCTEFLSLLSWKNHVSIKLGQLTAIVQRKRQIMALIKISAWRLYYKTKSASTQNWINIYGLKCMSKNTYIVENIEHHKTHLIKVSKSASTLILTYGSTHWFSQQFVVSVWIENSA